VKTRRLLIPALAVSLAVLVPGEAHAQLNPCAPAAPAPRRPDTGVPGWFASAPANPPAPSGSPSPEELFDTYGTAGLWWPSWDLGCTGSAEGLVTDMANVPMDWMSAAVNGTASVRRVASESAWLEPLDATASALTERLTSFYATGMGIALAAVGVWMIYRSRTARYGEITTAGAWALLMIALAAVALSYPAWAGRTYDDVVVGSAKLVNDSLAGETDPTAGTDPAVAQINGDVAYRVWLRGMFGSDSTRTAEVFGPRFYSAMAFAWSELPILDQGGPEADVLIERHRDAFVDAARDLETADPSAYRTMQGKGAFSTRIPTGLLGWVLVTALCFLAGVAAGLVLVARLIGRGLVMALPVVIPFGTLYRWSGPVRKLAGMAQAVAVVLITATIAGGILTRAVGALLATDWPLWLVGFISLVATYVSWRTLRPIGTVAGLVGLNGVGRVPKGAALAVVAALGARAGARSASDDDDADDDTDETGTDQRTHQSERYSAPPPDDTHPALQPAAPTLALTTGPGVRFDTADEPPPPPGPSSRQPWKRPPELPPGPGRPAVREGEPAIGREGEVLDTHPVIHADGAVVYEVYQRAEDSE
jgi:hypothetical protein